MKNVKLKVRSIKSILPFDEINVYGNFYNAKNSKYVFGDKHMDDLNKNYNHIKLYLQEDEFGFHLSHQSRKDNFAGIFTLYKNASKEYDDIISASLQFTSNLRDYNYGKIKETILYEDNKEVFIYQSSDALGIFISRYGLDKSLPTIIHEKKTDEEKKEWIKLIKKQYTRKD
jgi:hypothetical protein